MEAMTETELKKVSIVICLGSSCFSRGNNKRLKSIEDFLKINNLTDSVDLTGSLCEDKCSLGPNIKINGIIYHNKDLKTIKQVILDEIQKIKSNEQP